MSDLEYFVVARNPDQEDAPREIVDRYFQKREEPEGNHFERAKSRQGWLKFRKNGEPRYSDTRIYEARKMRMVRGDDGYYTFVSAEEEGEVE